MSQDYVHRFIFASALCQVIVFRGHVDLNPDHTAVLLSLLLCSSPSSRPSFS